MTGSFISGCRARQYNGAGMTRGLALDWHKIREAIGDLHGPVHYTHELNRGGKGVRSPMDGLGTGLIFWDVSLTDRAVQ